MQKPGFQFLWKRKLDSQPLTQPLLLPNIIAYKGFKALAFVASASGGVYSIDYELNRMFWEQKLRRDRVRPPPPVHLGCPRLHGSRRWRRQFRRTRGGGGGGGGRGRGAAGPQIANGRGGNDNLFVIGRDGLVHVMNPQMGTDQIPPVKFLPANANVSGSILVDNVLYADDDRQLRQACRTESGRSILRPRRSRSLPTTRKGRRSQVMPRLRSGRMARCTSRPGRAALPSPTRSSRSKRGPSRRRTGFPPAHRPSPLTRSCSSTRARIWSIAANKDGRLYVLDSGRWVGRITRRRYINRAARHGARRW